MPSVAVVTDSTHYLPRDLTERWDIRQVSLYVGWNGEMLGELEIVDHAAFYARLRDEPTFPSTSQPSIGDFVAVWDPLLDAGRDIVSVHLAGGISGTVEAARQAKALLDERGHPGRIEVLDGETACGGLGFLVLAGAAAANAGAPLEEVVAHIREARSTMRIWFGVDTLEYLRRGGRMGRAAAWVGGALQIKPILSLEYEIVPVERVRTARRAFERLVEYLRERQRDGADGWAVQHIQAHDQLARLVEQGEEIFGCEPLFTSEVGPVIGTYTGPGFVGVGAMPRRLIEL